MQLECPKFITCAADTITTSRTAMPPAAADHDGRGPLLSPASHPLLDRDDSQEDEGAGEQPASDDVDRSRRRRVLHGRSESSSSSSRSPFVPGCYTWPPPQQRQDSKSKLAAKLHASTYSDEDDYVLYTDDDDDNQVNHDGGSAEADVTVSAPASAAPVTPTPSSDAAFGCYSPPGEDEAEEEESVVARVAITAKNVPREQEPGFTDHSFAPPPPPSTTEDRGEESALALARKAAVGAVGGSLVGVGAVMIPLPIPMGVVVVAAGMAVLGTEFPQAKQVLVGARDNLATAVAESPSEQEGNGGDPQQERATEEEEIDVARAGRAVAADLTAAGEVDTDTDGEDVSPMPSPCGCGEAEREPEEEDGSNVGKGEGSQVGKQPPQRKPSFHRGGSAASTSSSAAAAPSLRRRGGYDDMCEDYSGVEKGVETAAREAKFALKRFGRKVLPLLDRLVQEPQPETTTTATATTSAAVGTKEGASTEQDGRRCGNEARHPEMGRKGEEDLARPQFDDKGAVKGKRNSIEIGPSPTLATCVSASSQDDGSSTSLICQRVTDDEDDR